MKTTLLLALSLLLSLLAYGALLRLVPAAGSTAVAFPVLLAVPVLGQWVGSFTFAGLGALGLFGYLGKKLA